MTKVNMINNVTYYRHNRMFAEPMLTKRIETWSVKEAVKHAPEYCGWFVFSTLLTADPIPDGMGGVFEVDAKEIDRGGRHFFGDNFLTIDDVYAAARPNESILRWNMKINNMYFIVQSKYNSVQEFGPMDCLVDRSGKIIRSGKDADVVAYRNKLGALSESERNARWPD